LYKGLEQVNCLEISSVTVEPEFQHKGHFKLFLENAEELCRDFSIDALYVGNVINKFLCKFLERQRYRRHTLGGQISYFKAL
jgi:N-acetylglutamate synthase-like GNAT family acetyltransferase